MRRLLILAQVHAQKIALVTAATLGAAAITGYVLVWSDQPTAAPAPPPAAITTAPDPADPHYGGAHGEDTEDTHEGERIHVPGPTTTPDVDMLTSARDFSTNWARPTLTTEAWLDGVDQYATNDYVRSVGDIDPARVPATKVIGDPIVVDSRTDEATIDVPTDGGVLRLRMVYLVGDWWVAYTEWLPSA